MKLVNQRHLRKEEMMRQIFYEGENASLNEAENSEKMSAANTETGSMNETADKSENNEMIDEVKKFHYRFQNL